MVILHPRAGRRLEVDSQQHQRPCGGSTPLRMPTNGLLRATGLEHRCVARSVQALPTQPNPRWHTKIFSSNKLTKTVKALDSISKKYIILPSQKLLYLLFHITLQYT